VRPLRAGIVRGAAFDAGPGAETSSIGPLLGLGGAEREELYRALDWLLERQPAIEKALAKRHLKDGVLVLYDVSSSYLEGRCCPLGQFGYSRDGKKGKLQIVHGLLCAADGCPVAVEVFEGATGDPATLAAQIAKIKHRFGLNRVVLVGDRGMITEARLQEEIEPADLDWITALRAPAIRGLVDGGVLQLSLFDQRNMSVSATGLTDQRAGLPCPPFFSPHAVQICWAERSRLTELEIRVYCGNIHR